MIIDMDMGFKKPEQFTFFFDLNGQLVNDNF